MSLLFFTGTGNKLAIALAIAGVVALVLLAIPAKIFMDRRKRRRTQETFRVW